MTNEEKILEALGEISGHLTKHDEMFGAINTRLDGIDERLDRMDERLDGIDERLDRMDERLDGVDSRLDKLEENTTGMRLEIENSIKPSIQKLTDGYASLRENMATKEQVEGMATKEQVKGLEESTTWMRLEIENSIKPNIQKLADGYALLRETMATKEQVENLREDIETEKVTLEILATKRLH